MTYRFLSVAEVLVIHAAVIDRHGGSLVLRDRGLLESAVAMPAAQFGEQFLHEDLAAMGAAYLFHLNKNHPFVDGNKRVALAATETFLAMNGRWIDATNDEMAELTLRIADGSLGKEAASQFIRSRLQTTV